MKILKKIGIVLLAIVLLIVIIGLFMPSTTSIEKSTVINAPVETVFDQVNTLTNWKKWSPWYKMDTAAVITYSGPASGNGASYAWDSKEAIGTGTLTLSDVVPNKHITQNMVFGGSNTGKATMDFEQQAGGVKVTWKMDMEHGWNVFSRIFGEIFMKGALGSQFEQGLADMKTVAEAAPVPVAGKTFNIQEIQIQPGFAVVTSGKVKETEFGAFYDKAFKGADAFIKNNNLKPTGAPFAIVYKYVPGGISELDAGIPVDKKIATTGNLKIIEIKGSSAVKADYYGDYAGSGVAHEAIDKWMQAKGKKAAGAPWEVYVTDPGSEPDTSKWLTEVIYPIQ